MKKRNLIASAAVLLCLLLSGCAGDALQAEQKAQRQAMADKQQADRQVERAEQALAVSAAATATATAHLAGAKQKQAEADAALQQILDKPAAQ